MSVLEQEKMDICCKLTNMKTCSSLLIRYFYACKRGKINFQNIQKNTSHRKNTLNSLEITNIAHEDGLKIIAFGAMVGATRHTKKGVIWNILIFMRAGNLTQKDFGWRPQKLLTGLSPLVLRSTARMHRCLIGLPTDMLIPATMHLIAMWKKDEQINQQSFTIVQSPEPNKISLIVIFSRKQRRWPARSVPMV